MLSKMMLVQAALMLLPVLVAFFYREYYYMWVFLAIITCVAALFLRGALKKPKDSGYHSKEGFVIVALAWIMWSLIAALTFYFTKSIPRFIDAFFEAVSGLTGTGATVIADIETLPRSVLFWRSFTNWIGGMGVLIFVMAVFPMGESHSMHLIRAEVAGPSVSKIVPKGRSSAKILYLIYICLTLLQVVFLLAGGMDLFDSVTHAFATAGTGGFSVKNLSIGYYDSAYIDTVITVFMILFSINFNMFYFLLIGKFATVFKNRELQVFLAVIAAACVFMTFTIIPVYGSFAQALRPAAFQVTSIISTTGFVTANYDTWPMLSKAILLVLMMVGACAGSTCGGIKISRILLAVRMSGREVRKMLHPSSVNVIKLDGKTVDEASLRGIGAFFIIYAITVAASFLVVAADGFGLEGTLSSVLSCLNCVGPGLGAAGPTENFAAFSGLSKGVLCFDMLLGRLEFFPILVLFAPSLWKRNFI